MRDLIGLYLRSEYEVWTAGDGLGALAILQQQEPDLILLDIMMPNLDGWAALRHIRERSSLPIIMLTARGEVPDRVKGLREGADDYIAKPFDGRELKARVAAVLRRASSASEVPAIIRRGQLVINPAGRTATWKGKPLPLTPKEFDLLTLLATHPGLAFSRDRLLDRIWGSDFTGEARTVDSHIKNLREKLGDGASLILTVWGVGYRFQEAKDAEN